MKPPTHKASKRSRRWVFVTLGILAVAAAVGACALYYYGTKDQRRHDTQMAVYDYYYDGLAREEDQYAALSIATAKLVAVQGTQLTGTPRKADVVACAKLYAAAYRSWATDFAALDPPSKLAAAHRAYLRYLRRAERMWRAAYRDAQQCPASYSEVCTMLQRLGKTEERSDTCCNTGRAEWTFAVEEEARRVGLEVH